MENSQENSTEMVHTKPETSSPPVDSLFWRKMWSTILLILPCLTLGALGCSNFATLSDQLVYVKHGGVIGNTTSQNDTGTCTSSLNKTGEDRAQSETTDFQIYSRMGRCAASFVFIPVWGAFSDQYGRHTAIIIGSAGAIAYIIPLLLVALLDAIPLWTLIAGDVLHGILGSSSKTLMVACASYAADVFQQGDRTLIMISFDLIYLLAYTVGQVGGGFWIKASGFVYVIICMLVLHVILIIYTVLFSSRFTKTSIPRTGTENKQHTILNYFTQSYHTLMKPRHGFNRTYLVITFIVVASVHFSLYGVAALFNIYTIGPPLCWNSIILGIFNGVNAAANAVVPLILGLIFLKCSIKATSWLVCIGLLSDLFHNIIFGFATTNILMIIGLVVGSCNMVVTSSARAIIADLVEPEEQGAAVAGYFLSSVVAELLCSPIFNRIFVATITFCNSCFFFVAASFDVLSLVLLGIYGCIKLKDKRQHYAVVVSTQVPGEKEYCSDKE